MPRQGARLLCLILLTVILNQMSIPLPCQLEGSSFKLGLLIEVYITVDKEAFPFYGPNILQLFSTPFACPRKILTDCLAQK